MTTKKLITRVSAFALLTLPPPFLGAQSPAEQSEIAALREQLARLSARLEALETKQTAATQASETATAKAEAAAAQAEARLRSLPDVSFGKKGVIVESPDDQYQFRFSGIFQTDGRFYPDTPGATDTFLIRRARPSVSGELFEDWDFRVQVELASNPIQILDAYLRYTYSPELRFKAGSMKTGVGLERLQSPANITFSERGLASNLTPTRDIGIELQGTLWDKRMGYQIGLFNGAPNNQVASADLNSPKTVNGRVFFQPWINEKDSTLQGLGFGFGGSYGNEANQSLPTQRSPGQLTFFQYNTGTTATGTHYRLNPQVFYYNGPFGLIAETVYDLQEFGRGGVSRDVGTWGWTIEPSWAIGGTNTYNGVQIAPGNALTEGGWGAWLLAARSGAILIDGNAFAGNAATQLANPATQVRTAIDFGAQVSWYPQDNLRFSLSYDNTHYSDGANRPTEHAVIGRAQVAF